MSEQAAEAIHAEHVGSLLRPPEALAARADHERGTITAERLRQRRKLEFVVTTARAI